MVFDEKEKSEKNKIEITQTPKKTAIYFERFLNAIEDGLYKEYCFEMNRINKDVYIFLEKAEVEDFIWDAFYWENTRRGKVFWQSVDWLWRKIS